LNILFLRQLVVGGGASNWTLAGEKLPDPKGRPLYKVMTFTNTVKASHVRGNGPLIVRATEWPQAELSRMADAVALHVLLHEYGHTLGDFAEFLGDLGSSVEETNAEASAIYQASRLAPDYLHTGVVYGACWTPVLRTMQGPTEAHSHSDIVLFDEYRQAGAVAVVDTGERKLVRAMDAQMVARIAFGVAMRMRLWEAGLALNEHQAVMEEFEPKDREQDERILSRALGRLEGCDDAERQQMRQKVLEEVRKYFATERLERAALPLREVIATLPKYQALSVIPSDLRVASLFSTAT
jgi:hypothetical protein